MAFSYTKQQQDVIDIRNRNVLVSAAAGSGKTAVLVERVIRMLLAQEVSLDEILVVTFTRAAASEMRERISEALNQALHQEFRRDIREQLTLLPFADITTIHSFCLKVIRENYSLLQLEPDFKIAEESETAIMAEEAMEELLEEEYERADSDFIHLARSFSTGVGDQALVDVIRRVYVTSQGMANPKKWLTFSVDQLAASEDGVRGSKLFQMMMQETASKFLWLRNQVRLLLDLVEDEPYRLYLPLAMEFSDWIERCLLFVADGDYDGVWRSINEFSSPALPRSRKGMDEELVAEIKSRIETLRQGYADLALYFQNDLATTVDITKNMQRLVQGLKRIVLEYHRRYQEKKFAKQVIDFNDIEHLALRLLLTEDGDRTEIAERYRERYREVIIDEYQDTNEVQDTILSAVAGAPERPNSFMVGDIKQSIYKFRQAKPEIFQEKYLQYGSIEDLYAKVDMQMNFRSRQEVLKLVNFIFRSIMTKEAAGIDYDERACFAFMEDKQLEAAFRPKLFLIEKDSYSDEEDSPTREVLEAEVIAEQILTLLESGKEVYDKRLDRMREIQVEDIAILMRSPSAAMATYAEVFLRYGIPLLVEEGKAYFKTGEVMTLTDFLKIMDNPRDDLALLGVLCSSIYQFEPSDLAEIKVNTSSDFMFERLEEFLELAEVAQLSFSGSDLTLAKVNRFLSDYRCLREESYFLRLSELVDRILTLTNYEWLVAMQPNGKQRCLNVRSFVEQIYAFEASGGGSLFQFLHRLDRVSDLDLQFGESIMEVTRAARIMSIHKSKGLEFPVVFLAQLGKAFNIRDISAPTVMKDDVGIIISDIDYERRRIREGFQKSILKDMLRRELLEEEQRLLYVALTRARDYLYLVGTVRKMDRSERKWLDSGVSDVEYRIDGFCGNVCNRQYLLSARSYLDFMMPSLYRAVEYGLVDMEWVIKESSDVPDAREEDSFSPEVPDKEFEREQMLLRMREYEAGAVAAFDFLPEYPYEELISERITVSVSEIKRAFEFEDLRADLHVGLSDAGSVQFSASQRGTVYHRVFALLPIDIKPEGVSVFLKGLVESRILTVDELRVVEPEDIVRWVQSDLWRRMVLAGLRDCLRREQPFIHAIPLVSHGVTEQRMMQGIIDAYFEEDGELVLLDYKTDRVGGDMAEAVFLERYGVQLRSYREALERITGLRVKQAYIYSVFRNEVFLVE